MRKASLQDFHSILQDPQESRKFEIFLEKKGKLCYLQFFWACTGLKGVEDKLKLDGIGTIYKRFILNGKIPVKTSTLFYIIDQLLQISLACAKRKSNEEEIVGSHLKILQKVENEVEIFMCNSLVQHFKNVCPSQSCGVNLNMKINENDGLPNIILQARILAGDRPIVKQLSPEEFAAELTTKLSNLRIPNKISENENCPSSYLKGIINNSFEMEGDHEEFEIVKLKPGTCAMKLSL